MTFHTYIFSLLISYSFIVLELAGDFWLPKEELHYSNSGYVASVVLLSGQIQLL